MKPLLSLVLALLALLALLATPARASPRLRIVAAESVYGDVAGQVAGADVAVTSILANPDQDPHLFEISPSVARAVAAAQVVISNGLDYDPWMDRLLAATRAPGRQVLVVARLAGSRLGDNPHVWFDPAVMLALAKALEARLVAIDPGHAAGYAQRLTRFGESLRPIHARTAMLRSRLQGRAVTATEPVFGAMLSALGLVSRNQHFQLAVMNETEPSVSDIAGLENDLRSHRVGLLVFNRQAADRLADHVRAVAAEAGVPIVGASETEPPGSTYQSWMLGELDALDGALRSGAGATAPP